MNKEVWIIRHGIRLDSTEKEKWEKTKRIKEHPCDTPLSEDGFKKAYQSGLELIKNSKAIQNKEVKYIYSSPLTRCIQTSVEIIKAVKDKLNYDIKIIIFYNLGESTDFPPILKFKGDKLSFLNPTNSDRIKFSKWSTKDNGINWPNKPIDFKLRPSSLKKKYNYIVKTIGKDIKINLKFTDEVNRVAKAIVNINKREKGSYIIVAHLGTSWLAYKYFNQKNYNIPDIKNMLQIPFHPNKENPYNIMMGFKQNKDGYDMIYEPNNKF